MSGGDQSITGGCFCGAARYRIQGSLGSGRSCHCSRCRKAFSGASSAYVEVQPERFHWLQGQDQLSTYEGKHGFGIQFCGVCGSTLAGLWQGQIHGVTLGCLDGDPPVEIGMHIFVDSRASWDIIGGDAPQYPEAPPVPGSDDS